MGGPWFAVYESNDTWKTFATLWIGNGESTDKAKLEIQLRLEGKHDASK